MVLTAFAEWLNEFFGAFDGALLGACHSAAEHAGAFLTPLAKVLTFVGEKGLIFFALALILVCFRRTRRMGVCLFGAVCCGALIGNIILKDLVARPRPLTEAAASLSRMVALCRRTCRGRLFLPVGSRYCRNGGRHRALPFDAPQNDAPRIYLRGAHGVFALLSHGALPHRRYHGHCDRRHIRGRCVLYRKRDIPAA